MEERICVGCFLVGFVCSAVLWRLVMWSEVDVAWEFIGVLFVCIAAIGALVFIDTKRDRDRKCREAATEARRLERSQFLH